jgi:hypothetical protein
MNTIAKFVLPACLIAIIFAIAVSSSADRIHQAGVQEGEITTHTSFNQPISTQVLLKRIYKLSPNFLENNGVEVIKNALAEFRAHSDSMQYDRSVLDMRNTDLDNLPSACYITDPVANITNAVNVLYPGDLSNWINYRTDGSIAGVTFLIFPLEGSVLTSSVQTFQFPEGYEGTITTPFGIPFWPDGNLTEGLWFLGCKTFQGSLDIWFFSVSSS